MQASNEASVEGRPGKLSILSQREQLLMSQLFKKKQELLEMRAKYEKLKTARISELGLSADGWVCSQCVCVGLKKKDICQVPSCKASNKSPENIKRVCTSCFISLTKAVPKSEAAGNIKKNPIKKRKKIRLYSILKPRKTFPKSTNNATKVCPSETEEDHCGRQDSEVFTKPPSVDHSETDTATETEEEQGERQRLVKMMSSTKETAKSAQEEQELSDLQAQINKATAAIEAAKKSQSEPAPQPDVMVLSTEPTSRPGSLLDLDLSTDGGWLEGEVSVWEGQVIMLEVSKFSVSAFQVSGTSDYLRYAVQ